MFSLRLLGTSALLGPDGTPPSGRASQPRRLALLAVLAVKGEDGWSRDQLAAMFWPDQDTERARHNLADALYVMRRELGDEALRTDGDRVRLDPARVESDVGAFERHLDSDELDQAVEAYGGPLLDGFHLQDSPRPFEGWVEVERRRLADRHAGALEKLARSAEERGELAAAVRRWRALTDRDPFNTRWTVGLVRALAGAGNRAAALRRVRHHRRILEEELGLPSPPELDAAAEEVRTAEARPQPPPATPDTPDTAAAGDFTARGVDVRGRATGSSPGLARPFEQARPPRSPVRLAGLVALILGGGALGLLLLSGLGSRVISSGSGPASSLPGGDVRAGEDRPTDDPAAWAAFLRARQLSQDPEGTQSHGPAQAEYERAIRLDPAFALAHAELSQLHSRIFLRGLDRDPRRSRLALHHAEWALALEPDLSEAHLALGYYYYRIPRQYRRAMENFDRAQAGLPDDADLYRLRGLVQRRRGRWEESIGLLERAASLDLQDRRASYDVLFNYLHLGRFGALASALDRYRERAPHVQLVDLWAAWLPAARDGDFTAARAYLFPVGRDGPRCPVSREAFDVCWRMLVWMGRLRAARALAEDYPEEWVRTSKVHAPRSLLVARSLALLDDPDGARLRFEEARGLLEDAVRAAPDDPRLRAALAHAYAGLGRADDALNQAVQAVHLLPIAVDALQGPRYLLELAEVVTAVGDRRRAVDLLQAYLSIPGDTPLRLVRVDPLFASLHELPSFAALEDVY